MKRTLSIASVVTNNGQVPGLPKNPRLIRDGRFEKLKRSIVDFPEMLELREIVVFPFGKKFVCIGGNMRYLACLDLGYKEIPAKVLPADFPVEKLAEFAIKDNVPFGEDDFDILANEWTDLPLEEWGLELPDLSEFAPNLEPEVSQRTVSAEDIVKTKAELDDHFKDADQYVEVICPHCAKEFFIRPN
jgi:hypothetical protein